MLQSAFAGQGKLILRATADGLASAEVTIDVTPAPARPAVPIAYPSLVIQNWRLSPFSAERPDPNQQIGDTDINSWSNVRIGWRLPTFNGGRFAIYRAQVTPRINVQKSGGQMNFRDVTGKAQVWIDGKLAGEKTNAGRNNFTVPFAPGDGERTVIVLVEAPAIETQAGLGGPVTIE